MKKFIFVFLFGLFFAAGAQAQVSVAEPEFAEQTLLLTSDSKGTLLTRENGTVKTKAGASLYRNRQGKIAFNRCRHHIEERGTGWTYHTPYCEGQGQRYRPAVVYQHF